MIPIALQLYSVRDDAAEDLAGTIRQVADMGYDGIEFAGFHGHAASDVRKMVEDAGLNPISSHARLEWLIDDAVLPQTIEDHLTIGCHALIIPGMLEEYRNTVEVCLATA